MSENRSLPPDLPKKAFKATFVVVFFVLAAIFSASLALSPRIYQSEVQIEIVSKTANAPVTRSADSTDHDNQSVLDLAKALRSTTMLTQIISALDLERKWGKRFNNGAPLPNDECISMLRIQTEIMAIPQTRIIHILEYSESPDESAQIANSFAETYRGHVDWLPEVAQVNILNVANPPVRPIRPIISVGIISLLLRSPVFALLAAFIARGISSWVSRDKILTSSPVPPQTQPGQRFQKY